MSWYSSLCDKILLMLLNTLLLLKRDEQMGMLDKLRFENRKEFQNTMQCAFTCVETCDRLRWNWCPNSGRPSSVVRTLEAGRASGRTRSARIDKILSAEDWRTRQPGTSRSGDVGTWARWNRSCRPTCGLRRIERLRTTTAGRANTKLETLRAVTSWEPIVKSSIKH